MEIRIWEEWVGHQRTVWKTWEKTYWRKTISRRRNLEEIEKRLQIERGFEFGVSNLKTSEKIKIQRGCYFKEKNKFSCWQKSWRLSQKCCDIIQITNGQFFQATRNWPISSWIKTQQRKRRTHQEKGWGVRSTTLEI